MAPQTVANFQDYADSGDWDGALVHRSVPGFVIQGGGFRDVAGAYATIPTDPPVPNEPCLSNTTGTIAMARIGGQPNSATSQWFVNLANNTYLDSVDGGFTAFGRVIGNGMTVVQQIAALPRFDTLAYLQLPYNQIFRERSRSSRSRSIHPADTAARARRRSSAFPSSRPPTRPVSSSTRRAAAASSCRSCSTGSARARAQRARPTCPCSSGRSVYEINLAAQRFVTGPFAMSCSAVSESEDSWAARRAGTNAHLHANDFAIISVPEPSAEWMRAAGLAAVGAVVAGARPIRLEASRGGMRSPRSLSPYAQVIWRRGTGLRLPSDSASRRPERRCSPGRGGPPVMRVGTPERRSAARSARGQSTLALRVPAARVDPLAQSRARAARRASRSRRARTIAPRRDSPRGRARRRSSRPSRARPRHARVYPARRARRAPRCRPG